MIDSLTNRKKKSIKK